jgi:hypothetical protein
LIEVHQIFPLYAGLSGLLLGLLPKEEESPLAASQFLLTVNQPPSNAWELK